ncbi:putative secreted transglycosylase (plasmid) [Actinacidiphila reveromycinica]|uniref:Putative secreted transglycosylase n=1 Tax=Actinacidiphila reveromycinica TaxID=659352 RepID=A0A7R6QEX1_9ACTN|nr:NlpC/P60 family protein [Streptomyces sp. SN-593]BBG20647.1 putative secreted transglycosylase [Streptomyces sp. SN-593]
MTAKQTWSRVGGAAAAALVLLVGLVALFVTVGAGAGDAAASVSAQYAAATPASAQSVGGDLKPGSVPAEDEQWIVAAADACPGLPAPVLAAQLHQESGFNPKAISPAGAQGIAQFMPGTWNTWKTDANGNGTASVWEAPDAITAQGHFMCKLLQQATDSGYAGPPIELALAGYNAGWGAIQRFHGVPPVSFAGGQTAHYVTAIMAAAQDYAAPAAAPGPYDLPATTPAAIRVAIAWGLKQLGGWYSLGGDCTNPLGHAPSTRCDCSSLIQQAYRAAGISLPRTTFEQVKVGTAVSPDSPLPGDLVFSPGTDGTASSPGHVGLYLGGGQLLEAPHTGTQTRVVTYASWRTSTSPIMRVVAVRRVVAW